MEMSAREAMMGDVDDLLRRLMGHYLRPKTPPSREMNVTMGQLHCLGAIAHLGTPSMSEVAAELGLHPSTVTVLVDGLVAHGLVRRWADPHDRRVVRVAETAKGRRNHERHEAEMRAQLARLLSALSDQDLERVRSSLQMLCDAAARAAAESDDSPPPSRHASRPKPGGTSDVEMKS